LPSASITPWICGVLTRSGARRGRGPDQPDQAHQRGHRAAGAGPVRVYQDFATLDLLSHGRAEITAGRSACTEPFDIFGVDLAQYDQAFSEKLGLLLQLRDQSTVTWSGNHRSPLNKAPITPRALQQPLPVWVGVGGSTESAARAGRLGLPMILGYIGGPLEHARRAVDIYRGAGDRAGHTDALRVGISTHFYAAATPEAARRTFPYYHEYLRPKAPGGRGFVINQAQFDAGTRRGNAIMIGSTEQLIEKILDAHEVLGLDRFLGQIDWGGLPSAAVTESIHLYAEDIAPAVRAQTASAHPGSSTVSSAAGSS
jgi:alkanesulfonate monooxygenase SsuD/methylene tetrahydromethanopterin reductase-like flavin-dependent oxidoreductase (luciferase family)